MLRERYRGIKRGYPNPVVCGRRFCGSCGRWRHVVDFHPVRHQGRYRLASYCDHCRRVRSSVDYTKLNERQRELRRENTRIRAEALRRRAGVPPRQFKNRRTVLDEKAYERVFLDREPLVREMRAYFAVHRYELRAITGQSNDGPAALFAALTDLDKRTIERILSGESKRVRVDVADKIAYAMGLPTSMLWAA